jgi:hypothetical protein
MRCACPALAIGLGVAFFALASPAFAQGNARENPSAEAARIISQYVKAAGGSRVLSRVRAISLQGTVAPSGDSPAGSFTLDTKSPNRYYSELILGNQRFILAFNGKSAWHLDETSAPATMLGPDSQEMLVEAQIGSLHLLDWKKNALAASFLGHATVQGKEALQVQLSSPFGAKRDLFFDPETHLLVEDSGTLEGLADDIFYSGYSAESGVQIPHRLEIHRGAETFAVTITSAEVNGVIGERVFDLPLSSQVKLPDLKALFKEIDEHQKAIDKLQQQYAGTEVEEEVEYGSGDKVKSRKVTESKFFHYDGEEISIVLSRDGKPLSGAEEKVENDNARKGVEEIRKRHAEEEVKKEKDKAEGRKSSDQDADNDSSDDDDQVGIETFLRVEEFVNPRRERFRGRDVLVFDFEANPEYRPRNWIEKIVRTLAGTIWIDEKDLDVVRLEAFFAKDARILGGLLASVHRGTAFVFEQEYVNNEVWLPTYEEAYFGARVLLLMGFRGSDTTRYSNYSKFDVDAAYPPANPPASSASSAPQSQ